MKRLEMAKQIVDWEARRDAAGNLRVYHLPTNDGGGTYEVAGINERYHPRIARHLKELIEDGETEAAEKAAVNYIAEYTDPVRHWTDDPAVELFLRDCAFNRGPGGVARILQMAVGTDVDGSIGPQTEIELKKYKGHTTLLLAKLRAARERYENQVAPGRANLRAGLEHRWDKAFEAAIEVDNLTGSAGVVAT